MFIKSVNIFAIDCSYTLSGKVIDEHDQQALDYATIYLLEIDVEVITDEKGNFKINDLCAQTYTCIIQHIGCKSDTIQLSINGNTKQDFFLEHHTEILQEIVTTATRMNNVFIVPHTLDKETMNLNTGKDFTELLAQINGVRILKTGATINKPIINGFYGDRVPIIYNGTLFSSQDWGVEHAPEIDINTVNQIKILDNVAVLEYTTQAIGACLLVELPPLKMAKNKQLGFLQSFQTNGLQYATAINWQQGTPKKFTYAIQTSFKKSADLQTPNYVMTNTAHQEIATTYQHKWIKNKITLYSNYNFINQNLGILSAAHIGNITDLLEAINSEQPLIILPRSYAVNNPKQKVVHHYLANKLFQQLKQNNYLEYKWVVQYNNREEYDIRRGNRATIPALDMKLFSNTAHIIYNQEKCFGIKNHWHWKQKQGISNLYKNNTNNPETGIKPLIPDYIQHSLAVFSTHELKINNTQIDFGARYEFNFIRAYTFNSLNEVAYKDYQFHNYNISALLKGHKHWLAWQIGPTLSSRSPNISELHSNGLHHGSATIEYGNTNLTPEHSYAWKTALAANYKQFLTLDVQHTFQYINSYIYIAPLSEPELTIRGAFPVYQYFGTNAQFNSIVLNVVANPITNLELKASANWTRAKDILANDYIFNMPSNAYQTTIKWHQSFKQWQNCFAQVTTNYILQQTKTPSKIIDYQKAPNSYCLLNLQMGTDYVFSDKHRITLSFAIDNLLNTSYRDYLNRFRYFSDEAGINFALRFNYFFNS